MYTRLYNKEYNRQYYLKNREKRNLRAREWKKNNPEKYKIIRQEWKKKNPKKYLMRHARERAKKKGFEFSIVENDFDIIEFCPVLGIALNYNLNKQSNNSPTLDRIDNSKGYIPGNVRIISWRANNLKSNGMIEEFEAIIKYMKEHNNKKEPQNVY